jgi:hypothetical protein
MCESDTEIKLAGMWTNNCLVVYLFIYLYTFNPERIRAFYVAV